MAYNIDCDVDLTTKVDVKFLGDELRSSSLAVSFSGYKCAAKFLDIDSVLLKFKKRRNAKPSVTATAVIVDINALQSALKDQLQELVDSAENDMEDYEIDVDFPEVFALESLIEFIEVAKRLKEADYQNFKDSDEPIPYSEASIEATISLTVTEF